MNGIYQELKQKLRQEPRSWLVTGVAGFIGSHLLEELLSLGQSVVGIDNFATGCKENLEAVLENTDSQYRSNFEFYELDINDIGSLEVELTGLDYVLHQAALGSVPRSFADPLATIEANIKGFMSIMQYFAKNKPRRLVYASSSSVYGDSKENIKVEGSEGKPLSLYAHSKCSNEECARIFSAHYGIETLGLRYFNVFGPRQNPNGPYAAVIPRWIGEILAKKQSKIFGDGSTTRDFCFVSNAVQANLLAACSDNSELNGKNVNISCGAETSLNQLYQIILELVAEKSPESQLLKASYEDFRFGDVKHSSANISLARSSLGYEPSVLLKEGLRETVEWFVNKDESAVE